MQSGNGMQIYVQHYYQLRTSVWPFRIKFGSTHLPIRQKCFSLTRVLYQSHLILLHICFLHQLLPNPVTCPQQTLQRDKLNWLSFFQPTLNLYFRYLFNQHRLPFDNGGHVVAVETPLMTVKVQAVSNCVITHVRIVALRIVQGEIPRITRITELVREVATG